MFNKKQIIRERLESISYELWRIEEIIKDNFDNFDATDRANLIDSLINLEKQVNLLCFCKK